MIESTQVPLISTSSQRDPRHCQNQVYNNPEAGCLASDGEESVRKDIKNVIHNYVSRNRVSSFILDSEIKALK